MAFSSKLITNMLCAALLAACNTSTKEYMVLGDVEYIKEFPNEIIISDSKPYMSDFERMVSFKAIDSVMIGIMDNHSQYYYELHSLKNGAKYAELLKKGNGPDEYPQRPSIIRLYKKEGVEYADLLDRVSKKILRLNITSSIRNRHEIIDSVIFVNNVQFTKDILPINCGDTLAIEMGSYDNPLFMRCVRGIKGSTPIPNLDEIQKPWPNVNPNTVSGIVAILPGDSIVIEAMIELNQILNYKTPPLDVISRPAA